MTMVLVVWMVLITALLFGDTGLNALRSGMQKMNTRLEARKESLKAIESHVDEKTGDDLAHKIRAAEIEAEMHLQGNGFVLTTCENKQCDTCYPGRFEPASGYSLPKRDTTIAGWPGTLSEYEAYLEKKHRPKALGTTPAGAAAKAGLSKRPPESVRGRYYADYHQLKEDHQNLKKDLERFREEFTTVSGAGERIKGVTYDYIIVNGQSYQRPSEVPDHAEVEIRTYWDENFLVWTWPGHYQGRTTEMYYKQPM
jgi:hypothetical protein